VDVPGEDFQSFHLYKGAREKESQGEREPGRKRAREKESQGEREPGRKRAREKESQGEREPGRKRAREKSNFERAKEEGER